MIQLGKFYFDDQWQPKKYNVEVDVPNEFTLAAFMDTNEALSPEEILPEEAPIEVQVDATKLNQMIEMGMNPNASKRALHATQEDVNQAFEWLMNHMEDTDINTPLFIRPAGQASTSGTQPAAAQEFSPDSIAMIQSMGFTDAQAKRALSATNGSVERAVDWIFSHADELNEP